MKKITLALLLVCLSILQAQHQTCSHGRFSRAINTSAATDLRSDTIDLIHNSIEMTFDVDNKEISARSVITFKALMNDISTMKIDLEGLNVTSMQLNGSDVSYEKSLDTIGYRINSNTSFSKTKEDTLVIEYSGSPRKEVWGGFSWDGEYAYHIGVAFQAIPHSYGRVTFPCFDNFVEKTTYDFTLTCPKNKLANAVGVLTDSSSTDSTNTYSYQMNHQISSYLVGIHVGPYEVVHSDFDGIEESIPVEYYAKASDTTAMKNSFVNLEGAFDAYEESYGPYPFDKIGYSLVPFSSGAMEHATNISYPILNVQTNTGESTMAHELAHMWWGNKVTTENAGMMWLNEGWASYCEFVFWEAVYGQEKYYEEVKNNQVATLQYAHFSDSGYYAINDVPLEWTYGRTTYDKGAMVVNNLRNFVGNDSLFNDCMMKFLDANAWGRMSGTSYQEFMEGYFNADFSGFFDGWVYSPGFPDFKIDYWGNGVVQLSQQLRAKDNLVLGMPLELAFYDADWNVVKQRVYLNGGCGKFNYSSLLDFEPIYVALDMDEKMADAGISDYKIIDSKGFKSFNDYGFKMRYQDFEGDSVLVRVVLHMTPAQPQSGLVLSNTHYWKVEGIKGNEGDGYFEFAYDGRESTYNGQNWDLDLLNKVGEADLKLYYRSHANEAWSEALDVEHNMGSETDKSGNFRSSAMLFGEYAIGTTAAIELDNNYITHTECIALNVNDLWDRSNSVVLYPNPSIDFINLDSEAENVFVINMEGKKMKTLLIGSQLDVKNLPKGNYTVEYLKRGTIFRGRFTKL